MIEIIPNLHPVFVHFTVASLLMAAAFYVVSFLGCGTLLLQVSRFNLFTGIALTAATVAAGFYAYNSVQHDAPSHAAMTDHRNWALVTVALWAVIGLWEGWRTWRGQGRSLLVAVVLVIGAALVGTTGFKGGELVFVYGLGVQSLPNTDSHQHPGDASSAHAHEAGMDGHAGSGHDNGHEDGSGERGHETAGDGDEHSHGGDQEISPPVDSTDVPPHQPADKPSGDMKSAPVAAEDKTHVHSDGSSHTH